MKRRLKRMNGRKRKRMYEKDEEDKEKKIGKG